MTALLEKFFEWGWGLIGSIQTLYEWLFTPMPLLSELIGFDIAPIYLVGGGAVLTGALIITIGIIRAIA